MHAHEKILDRKTYALAALAVVSFSHCVVTWFGRTMPGVVVDFFKGVGEYVVLTAAVIFILAWLLRARPHAGLKLLPPTPVAALSSTRILCGTSVISRVCRFLP